MTPKERLEIIKKNTEWIHDNPGKFDGVISKTAANNHHRGCLEEEGTIQNCCMYGYVLPDRCRYNSITGCDCGAYPPLK